MNLLGERPGRLAWPCSLRLTPRICFRHMRSPSPGLTRSAGCGKTSAYGPDEIVALTSEIVAVETATAVVRVEVRYGDPVRQEYRDLWVMTFDSAGRCRSFEEWPFWPGRPYSAPRYWQRSLRATLPEGNAP